MASAVKSETRKSERGRVQFDSQDNGKTVTVHLDRLGFRRLLETLQRLAETGEHQSFDKSGRARAATKNGAAERGATVSKLVFHIESESET
ncbi:MAG: hypothetical protein AAFO01_05380 [Pseudomonadota bacterium]